MSTKKELTLLQIKRTISVQVKSRAILHLYM